MVALLNEEHPHELSPAEGVPSGNSTGWEKLGICIWLASLGAMGQGHPTDLFCKISVLREVQLARRFSEQINLIILYILPIYCKRSIK